MASKEVSGRFWAVESSAIVMDNSVTFTVHGEPMALARPKVGTGRRSTQKTVPYHTYSPSKPYQKLFIAQIQKCLLNTLPIPEGLTKGVVSVDATFHFARPQSHFQKGGIVKPSFAQPFITCKKADLDNLAKFLLDCLQGLVIGDDHLVAMLVCRKVWSDEFVVDNGKCTGCGYTAIRVVALTR